MGGIMHQRAMGDGYATDLSKNSLGKGGRKKGVSFWMPAQQNLKDYVDHNGRGAFPITSAYGEVCRLWMNVWPEMESFIVGYVSPTGRGHSTMFTHPSGPV